MSSYICENIALAITLFNPTSKEQANVTRLSKLYKCCNYDNSIKNIGIAAAQNEEIKLALSDPEIKYIVFVDQDSEISDDYPQKISKIFSDLEQKETIGIVGPTYINNETGHAYPISDIVISSGSCVSREVFGKVGLFNPSLFIDYVDFEWCWRALSKGFSCRSISDLTIRHQVGTRFIKFGKYVDIISKPFRYYYQYRNYLWLSHLDYAPKNWKIRTGVKNILRLFYAPFFTDDAFGCYKHIFAGIIDGLFKYRRTNMYL